MPSELEDLVEFLHHGNTQIRQIAAENLVGYSTAQPSLFKRNQLEPVRDLKLLIKDYPPIAKNAITILINISDDAEVLEALAGDGEFLESLLRRLTDPKEPNADLLCMLLANLSKSPSLNRLLTLDRETPQPLSTSPTAIDHLLDLFVKGADASYNKHATFDYLSYLFADLAKHDAGRRYFLDARVEAGERVVPLAKLVVFTEHGSPIRRRGVANTLKNVCFDVGAHAPLLATPEEEDADLDDLDSNPDVDADADADAGAGEEAAEEVADPIPLLPYLLPPLMGPESYSLSDSDGMLSACTFLPPTKQREAEADILATHLESLLLLTTEKAGRAKMRRVKVYPILRTLHEAVEDDSVREGCDRLVQVLMRGEEGEADPNAVPPEMMQQGRITEVEEEDEDDKIVDVV